MRGGFKAQFAWRRRAWRLRSALLLGCLLLIGALYPTVSGLRSRAGLQSDGATLVNHDHPVVRIHRARGRLLEFRGREWQADTPLNTALRGWFVVAPGLIVHPLTLLALCALPLLIRRPQRERRLLLPATLIPLAIAFVPPIAALAGRIVLPWMVYRILWFVPFGALLAVLIHEAIRWFAPRSWIVFLIVVGLALPGWADATLKRLQPDRTRLGEVLVKLIESDLFVLRRTP